MSSLILLFIIILAVITTAWVVINRRKETVLEKATEEAKRQQAIEHQKKDWRVQKYMRLQAQLKKPLIQSLWALCDEACSLGLVDTFSDEQFNVSHDDQRIELTLSWVAKSDGESQLALRRLVDKHAASIENKHNLSLINMVCGESRMGLEFAENTVMP